MLIYNKEFFYREVLGNSTSKVIELLANNKYDYYQEQIIITNGKRRRIEIIEEGSILEKLQISLKDNFLNNLKVPGYVCGFTKGKSYKDYLQPHIRLSQEERYYIRLDIKKYFESITDSLILEALSEYVKLKVKEEEEIILKSIIEIVTYKGTLPQGAITSPVVSNVVFRKIDLRIRKYCEKLDIVYSRYADDMLFSSTNKILKTTKLINLVESVLRDYSFELNRQKTIRVKNYISLNGFVVGEELSISRKKLSEIKNVLFKLDQLKDERDEQKILDHLNVAVNFRKRAKLYSLDGLIDYLAGYRSFLISWIPVEENDWQRNCLRTIERIEKTLNRIIKVT